MADRSDLKNTFISPYFLGFLSSFYIVSRPESPGMSPGMSLDL